jgi:hypothetical protein
MESQQSESGGGGGQRDGERDGGHGGGRRTFGDAVERVGDTAQQAWSRTRDAVDDIKGTLDVQGRVDRHPYGTVAAALGIGYVLGGGLFSPLTARIIGLGVRIGLRLAAIPVLRDELFGLAEALGDREAGGEEREPREGGRRTREPKTKKENQP